MVVSTQEISSYLLELFDELTPQRGYTFHAGPRISRNCRMHQNEDENKSWMWGIPQTLRIRNALHESSCPQCNLWLVLKAIDRIIPHEEMGEWMETPHVDLQDKMPLDCLREGNFEPVINALWRYDGACISS